MNVVVIRCMLGDLEAVAMVEVSVKLVSCRSGSQGIGAKAGEYFAAEGQARRPYNAAMARPAMMCGPGR